MNKKKIYLQPISTVTRVELESPICSGSADVTNTGDTSVAIKDQEVNTDFDYTLSSGNTQNSGWDEIK